MRRISIRGFTMIELLIVIAIIGIVATVGLGAAFGQSRKAAKDAKMKSHISALQIALESYYADNKQYPDSATITALTNALSPDFITPQTKSAIDGDVSKYPEYNTTYTRGPGVNRYTMSITLQVDGSNFVVEGQ